MVPNETWHRALTWYQKNYHLKEDGSYAYSLGDSTRFNGHEVIYAATSGALASLKIISMFTADPQVRTKAQELIVRTLGWLEANYAVELNAAAPSSWFYNYLFGLRKGCMIAPYIPSIGSNDWYADMVELLIKNQQTDGRWVGEPNKKSTDVIYTSLALICLANTIEKETNQSKLVDSDTQRIVSIEEKAESSKEGLLITDETSAGSAHQINVSKHDLVSAWQQEILVELEQIKISNNQIKKKLNSVYDALRQLGQVLQEKEVESLLPDKTTDLLVEEGTFPKMALAVIGPSKNQVSILLNIGKRSLIKPGFKLRLTIHNSTGGGQFYGVVDKITKEKKHQNLLKAVIKLDRQPKVKVGMPVIVEVLNGVK